MTARPPRTRHSFTHAGQVIHCHVEAARQPVWIAMREGRGYLIGPTADFDFRNPAGMRAFQQLALQQMGLLPPRG